MKKIIKNKKIILIVVILVIAVVAVYKIFFSSPETFFTVSKAVLGQVLQEVSETGTIERGDNISLSFKSGGKIELIYVAVGEDVKYGQALAKIETSQLSIQLEESKASLEVAKAQFGSSQTSVQNAQTALASAQQNLADVEDSAGESSKNAYEDALNTLNDAYLKIYNALDTVKTVQQTYFSSADQEGSAVFANKLWMQESLDEAKLYLDKATAQQTNENIDSALSVMKQSLEKVYTALATIRQTCDASYYRDLISSTYKTSLDTHRANISSSLASVINSQQTISTAKITGDANINAAKSQISVAQGNLEKAQKDIGLYSAQVDQAKTRENLILQQIADSTLSAPADGQITKINKKAGETVQISEPVFSFISSGPFQIAVDIYEEDVVKISTGNSVDIKVAAFPEKIFQGKVIFIDPAEKIIDGVVYYETKIDFESAPKELRPGMTADITIKAMQKDNVLVVPKEAVEKIGDKNFVKIPKGKNFEEFEEKEIQIGLTGTNDMVEVISGLNEGDEIAIEK